MAMAVVMGCAFFMGAMGRKWFFLQFLGSLSGMLLYKVFVWGISSMGFEVLHLAGDRISATMSSRGVLWGQAILMMQKKPILGFGPMHFANIPNSYAAHPHQSLLQWVSEWGVPSAILMAMMVIFSIYSMVKHSKILIKENDPNAPLYFCLSTALFSSLVQSQVDGVFVIPYTQFWIVLILGWLISVHFQTVGGKNNQSKYFKIHVFWIHGILFAVVLMLFSVFIYEAPRTYAGYNLLLESGMKRYEPRFWLHGVIGQSGK
ncbi:O-antigen ligase family protein [Diaphorobacter aerolatus]|nr:O-antigen ligase family protein [Diaphorobacter aerolatus]